MAQFVFHTYCMNLLSIYSNSNSVAKLFLIINNECDSEELHEELFKLGESSNQWKMQFDLSMYEFKVSVSAHWCNSTKYYIFFYA